MGEGHGAPARARHPWERPPCAPSECSDGKHKPVGPGAHLRLAPVGVGDVQQLVHHVVVREGARVVDRRARLVEHDADERAAASSDRADDLAAADPLHRNRPGDAQPVAPEGDGALGLSARQSAAGAGQDSRHAYVISGTRSAS